MGILLFLLLAQFAFIYWNKRNIMDFYENQPFEELGISILIPARNEARNISKLLESLETQLGPQDEVLIYDDQSTDATSEIASKYTCRILHGQTLPTGWTGKNFACHNLAAAAQNEWLLFLDADVVLKEAGLRKIKAAVSQRKTKFVFFSGFPQQKTKDLLSFLLVPMMKFIIFSHLPLRYISQSANPLFAVACGQFILTSRKVYMEAGGHEAIKGSMLDDVALVKQVKITGFPVAFVDIEALAACQMYNSPSEVMAGFQKNLFAGMGFRFSVLVPMTIWYLGLYILPWILLVAGMVSGDILLPFSTVIVSLAIGILVHKSVKKGLALPLSVGLALFVAYKSAFQTEMKWKGRSYK
ncbi:glycosyltransferase [Listeria grayi]|uniref:glycosyltransferase n=1 Tax=Listeria grayi TaxID=1641 RepID=UPI0016293F0C|nr:glycosyltransferase [Listeria grayi]MBC1921863.1 glycosyltransferase [Listeria grayi]